VDVSTTDWYDCKVAGLERDRLITCDGWPDFYQQCNAFKPHCRETITWECRGKSSQGAMRSGWVNGITPEERAKAIKSQRCSKTSGDIIHMICFQRTPKTILKYYLQFYLFKITSLNDTRDWALYAWTSLYSSWVRNVEGCRKFRQLAFRIARAPFNPQLWFNFSSLSDAEYRLPGAEISQHHHFTLGGMFPVVIRPMNRLIFGYIGDDQWHRFDFEKFEEATFELACCKLGGLTQGQEVES